MLKPFAAILKTELRLATRNPDMILFGIIFPIGVMLLLGFISEPEALRLDFGRGSSPSASAPPVSWGCRSPWPTTGIARY